MKLPLEFYLDEDVEKLSKALLGKYLVSNFDGQLTSGMIVETEAYAGVSDKASHAYSVRRTQRTEIMYMQGGTAYVYLIYGIHALFNVVTNKKDTPHAVLIRAIEPVDGIETMLTRRNLTKPAHNLCGGPGLLTSALGISTKHSGISLLDNTIWIEDRDMKISDEQIISSPRVGVSYAKEDALLPRRYRIKYNLWTSKAK